MRQGQWFVNKYFLCKVTIVRRVRFRCWRVSGRLWNTSRRRSRPPHVLACSRITSRTRYATLSAFCMRRVSEHIIACQSVACPSEARTSAYMRRIISHFSAPSVKFSLLNCSRGLLGRAGVTDASGQPVPLSGLHPLPRTTKERPTGRYFSSKFPITVAGILVVSSSRK